MEKISLGAYDRHTDGVAESIEAAKKAVRTFPKQTYKSSADQKAASLGNVLEKIRSLRNRVDGFQQDLEKQMPREWKAICKAASALEEAPFNHMTSKIVTEQLSSLSTFGLTFIDLIESDVSPIHHSAKASALAHVSKVSIENPAIERDIDLNTLTGHGVAVKVRREDLILDKSSLLQFDHPLMTANTFASREQARRNRLIMEETKPLSAEREMIFTRSLPEFKDYLAIEAQTGETKQLFKMKPPINTYQERIYG